MPAVNIFYKDWEKELTLQSLVGELKDCVAKELTCGDIKLKSSEIVKNEILRLRQSRS